jgi:hypothetical protein
MKNINTLKRKCHVGINVVFLEVILKLCDVCFMKNIFQNITIYKMTTMYTYRVYPLDIFGSPNNYVKVKMVKTCSWGQ